MSSKFKLESTQIKKNIEAVKAFMNLQGLESFYISSFDPFLNEYVPMIDCHRYYLTGFSGSVAEALVLKDGKVRLYVDGRYHEQADLECDLDLIDVVKVPSNYSITQSLKDDLKELNPKNVAIEADRTSLAFYEYLNSNFSVKVFSNQDLYSVIDFAKLPELSPVKQISAELSGKSTAEKLSMVLENSDKAYFITAIDSLAWLTNSRGYHLPNLSSFLGRGFALKDKVYVFVSPDVKVEVEDSAIEFINCETTEIEAHLKTISSNNEISELFIDKNMLNTQDFLMLKNVFGEDKLIPKAGGLVEFHAIKDEAEIRTIRASFKKADKAIFNTINWIKSEVKAGRTPSELDLYNKTSEMYQEQGAVEQSFGTIAGADANGSIIHYSDPKADVLMTDKSMVLLDSGGYFEGGFATDTTRTFMAGTVEGSAEQKKIYTLVLKGTLALQNAVFKTGTRGSGLDAICRQPLYQAGYDYAHGTGHGVGIHVHEGGAGISPVRNYLLKPGQVISIEPGIYIPGFGGVRLENIGLVVEHPKYEGFLTFESLVNIGFDPLLIDESMLTAQEKTWLEEYEAECIKAGNSFLLG